MIIKCHGRIGILYRLEPYEPDIDDFIDGRCDMELRYCVTIINFVGPMSGMSESLHYIRPEEIKVLSKEELKDIIDEDKMYMMQVLYK